MKANRVEVDMEAIISADEIKVILDRYRIGKKPLAKLLGWGETTIIRYMEGDIPTNEYSNKLKAILEDPEFYYDLLCKRKECLTGVAFKKSKKAVMSNILASKIYAIAYYIVNKCNANITADYIQYLLFYTQAFSLVLCNKELFEDDIRVNDKNIPYPKLYEGMKRCGIHTLEDHEIYLNTDEARLIDAIMDSFLWYGPKALKAMLELDESLIKKSYDLYGNRIIAKEELKNYFLMLLYRYDIKDIKDIYKYPDRYVLGIREKEPKDLFFYESLSN